MSKCVKAILLGVIVPLMALVVAVPGARAASGVASRIAVRVECTCEDATGKAYMTAFKEALKRDVRYDMEASRGSGDAVEVRITSRSVTTPEGRPGSAISVTCTHNGVTMHEDLVTCIRIPVDDCARSMEAGLGDLEMSAE